MEGLKERSVIEEIKDKLMSDKPLSHTEKLLIVKILDLYLGNYTQSFTKKNDNNYYDKINEVSWIKKPIQKDPNTNKFTVLKSSF